jgi:trans-aconitate 2-methyltransferase
VSGDVGAAGQRASGARQTQDWDAVTYDRVSAPQQRWAQELLERLELQGDEVVLDAGCGSGKVTAQLVELVPRGRVYAVDLAPSMVAHTQAALGDKVTALCQSLTELSLPERVDAIFSNATFHWIHDHDALFAALRRALKDEGRIVAQFGGIGNIDTFRKTADEVAHSPEFASYFEEWARVWNYPSAEETAHRLRNAGFTEVRTWLEPRPTLLEDPAPFVRTVCLVRHLDMLPETMHERFVDAVLERTGVPLTLDYVRLNMVARAGRNLPST